MVQRLKLKVRFLLLSRDDDSFSQGKKGFILGEVSWEKRETCKQRDTNLTYVQLDTRETLGDLQSFMECRIFEIYVSTEQRRRINRNIPL